MKQTTLGELKKSSYLPKSIRTELRSNLIRKLSRNESLFEGIHGYDKTVIPEIERALLSGHNILFLGLRGQAKTKMARLLAGLLDEYIPIVKGSDINDDPFNPISKYAKELISKSGDDTPIEWLHRSERFVEKLATPDVSVSDLIGDLDPIKAAKQNIGFDSEYAIHFGLIPRSNRSIFVLNELPDLQARIQVSLLNIMEEQDLQIRGFKLKLPLDLYMMFTANPEDYTQRGNIITPLKDRIESQILTHYPEHLETALDISQQEAKFSKDFKENIKIPQLLLRIIEQISFCARDSELVDEKSGVSARMSVAALELLYSSVERRMIINKEKSGVARLTDLLSIIPALTGKLELVFEGEQLGLYDVALNLINEAIEKQAGPLFPEINNLKSDKSKTYKDITDWFSLGNKIILDSDCPTSHYMKVLSEIPSLEQMVKKFGKDDKSMAAECILHLLASTNAIQRDWLDFRVVFKDQLASMLNDLNIDSN